MSGPSTSATRAAGRLLDVRDLSIALDTELGRIQVLDRVSLTLDRGETLGVVGESGSGKTMTALAIMGLIGQLNGRIISGEILYGGRDLALLREPEIRTLRGGDIAMIFQQPRRSLDPNFTVGDQIAEVVRVHRGMSRRAAWSRAVEMLDLVRIPSASRRAHEYPHSFSGGMCQRVMLAIALAASPAILIADEPTTALDVTVQAQILDLLKDLQGEMGLGILFITHDLGVIAQVSDRVSVMYAGQVVEQGDAMSVFHAPRHPYTAALLAATPDVAAHAMRRLDSIPGQAPMAEEWPAGCRFHPRCGHAVAKCGTVAPALDDAMGTLSRCLRLREIVLKGV